MPDEQHVPTSQAMTDVDARWSEDNGADDSSPALTVVAAKDTVRISPHLRFKDLNSIELEIIVRHTNASTPVPLGTHEPQKPPTPRADEIIDLTLPAPAVVEQDPAALLAVPRTWQVPRRGGAGSSSQHNAQNRAQE